MDMGFENLLKKISPVLKRITYRLNGHYAFFNDEDLYQEALIHLWQDYQEGKLQDKTDSYILQGCYFYLKNYLRKAKIKAGCISLDALNDEEGVSLEEKLIPESAKAQDCRNYLNSKLLAETINGNGLDEREKRILSFCAEGLTTREIGARLGISHVRVVKLMHRIKEKCKKYLE